MRRRLRNLKNKSGHSENGSPRQMIDEMVYREHGHAVNEGGHYDSAYAGWSWASRPRDSAISIRRQFAGATSPSGPA